MPPPRPGNTLLVPTRPALRWGCHAPGSPCGRTATALLGRTGPRSRRSPRLLQEGVTPSPCRRPPRTSSLPLAPPQAASPAHPAHLSPRGVQLHRRPGIGAQTAEGTQSRTDAAGTGCRQPRAPVQRRCPAGREVRPVTGVPLGTGGPPALGSEAERKLTPLVPRNSQSGRDWGSQPAGRPAAQHSGHSPGHRRPGQGSARGAASQLPTPGEALPPPPPGSRHPPWDWAGPAGQPHPGCPAPERGHAQSHVGAWLPPTYREEGGARKGLAPPAGPHSPCRFSGVMVPTLPSSARPCSRCARTCGVTRAGSPGAVWPLDTVARAQGGAHSVWGWGPGCRGRFIRAHFQPHRPAGLTRLGDTRLGDTRLGGQDTGKAGAPGSKTSRHPRARVSRNHRPSADTVRPGR